ncbi:MAG TPA: phosphohistidine phosphatase SixA [Myxococcota bacterium]|nr:phosphohistidine phosphatase SixA [Myxococcota bacterium]
MTTVYIMRHGLAESGAGRPDEERRLTPEGVAQMRRAVLGLERMGVQIDRIVASPLKRTVQTAELVAEVLAPGARVIESVALSTSGSAAATLGELLSSHGGVGRIFLVGHLPDVAVLVGLLIRGEARGSFNFAPGSLACVHFDGAVSRGGGTLRWLMSSAQLQTAAALAP